MTDLFASLGDFDSFWQAFPRKIAKGAAKKAYDRALKKVPHDTIMWGLSQQLPAMQSKETKFIPHATTWLNQERWDDEPDDLGRGPSDANTGAQQIAFAAAARRSPSKDCF